MLRPEYSAALLTFAASISAAGAGPAAPCSNFRFDAMDCVGLANPAFASGAQLVFQNRCAEPIAILVAACDLTAHPSCKSDPLRSRGWAATRGIEYLQGAEPRTLFSSLHLGRNDELRLVTSAVPRGWRAQIIACRLGTDGCTLRLRSVQQAVEQGDGQSLHAVLRESRASCKRDESSIHIESGEAPWA